MNAITHHRRKTEASGKPKEERVRDLLTWRYVQSGAVPSGAANKRAVRPQQCKRAVSCSSGKCWEEWELWKWNRETSLLFCLLFFSKLSLFHYPTHLPSATSAPFTPVLLFQHALPLRPFACHSCLHSPTFLNITISFCAWSKSLHLLFPTLWAQHLHGKRHSSDAVGEVVAIVGWG